MRLQLNLIESNNDIQKKILLALLPDAKSYMDKAFNIIKSQLPNIVYSAIINTPEYVSLTSGELKFEFGIPDANRKITTLIDLWMSNIIYNYKKPTIISSQIRSSLSVSLIKADFSDVLGVGESFVQDSSGYSLPWLKWLLLDGSAILVPNHSVVFGPNPKSRTGNAIMRLDKNRGWSVPSQYQGTESNNWITRALDNAAPEIEKLINGAMAI